MEINRKALESKIALLTQKLASEEEISKKKIEKLKQDVTALTKRNIELSAEADKAREDLQGIVNKSEESFNKLKDLLFEKNDLELKYNQSLAMVESENEHIKKLNIRIS